MRSHALNWPSTRIRREGARARTQLKHRRVMKSSLVVLAILLGCGLFHVWSRVQIMQSGYAVQQAQEEKTRLLEQQRVFRLEEETLTSPKRLEQVAREILGMSKPNPEQTIYVNEGSL